MKRKILTQEGLKLIACVSMLIDHIGAVLLPGVGYRIIGRLSFPIYCFLLSEGIAYSRNHKRYCLRLGLVALLAELPYDLLFYGGITWDHQSVMLTLLMGVGMILWARKTGNFLLPFVLCFFAAEFLHTDYGGWGIALIALFAQTTNLSGGWLFRLLGMGVLFLAMDSYPVPLLGLNVPIQLFGLLALIPIQLYSGRKHNWSRKIQGAFYLFYPAHLVLLYLLRLL